MNHLLFVFLSLSLSGAILAFIFLTIKPLIKNRLSQTWQYYIWLVVILRLLLPVTPQVSIVGEAVQYIQNAAGSPAVAAGLYENSGGDMDDRILQTLENTIPEAPYSHEIVPLAAASSPSGEALHYAWLFWLNVALALFVHKVVSYRNFVRFVRAGARKVTDTRILGIFGETLAEAGIKRRLTLYRNEQVSSPMLVGIFQPMIVLPPLGAGEEALRNIFRHELTHFRRLDFLYKWLVQITICLHWFNPLVYIISKQINQSCELSCDEAVIKRLDEDSRLNYGDALIASLNAQGSYSDFVVSITMSENANLVKERLDAIMKYRKQKKWAIVPAVILAVVLSTGSYALGATSYDAALIAGIKNIPLTPDMADSDVNGTVVIDLKNNEGQKNIIHSSSFEADAGQVLTLDIQSSVKGAVDLFLFSPSYKEQRITITGNDGLIIITLPEGGQWSYNCTGFFDSGDISIVGTLSADPPEGTKENPADPEMTEPKLNDPVVINLRNNEGQKNLMHSSGFEAKTGQVLTLEITSTISGTVDLFLFSPDSKEQRITFGGSNETKTINLSEGRWSYNCTGIFDSGDISILGTIK